MADSDVLSDQEVVVIGGGLAGCECALQLAKRNVSVRLIEQRPLVSSPAHHTDGLAELVCSNSLKSLRFDSAAGLLKRELVLMGSSLMEIALSSRVQAGGALAVDREEFSQKVTEAIECNPHITLVREEATEIPQGPAVIAAGPLCSDTLFEAILDAVGGQYGSFYDAAAPIVDATTIDRNIVFAQSRYEQEGSGDYLNCPMNREQYEAFIHELVSADRVIARSFEQTDLFCACQPVEEIARTGIDSLRFGALKPVGLTDPATQKRPWAAVQLRAETSGAAAYNLVGFQTNLTWPEQRRVFRMIPGLEHAEFFRYGVMHRNSFIDSPKVLDATFAIPHTATRFAGQITGTEGYTEAIASGLLAALNTYAQLTGASYVELPKTGAFGSLVQWATSEATDNYQPMHVNFGIFPPLEHAPRRKRERYAAYATRALEDLTAYIDSRADLFSEGACAIDNTVFEHE